MRFGLGVCLMFGRLTSCSVASLLTLVPCLPVAASDPPAQRHYALPVGVIARLGDARLRHAAAVLCVTLSPDNRRIVTGGKDGSLKIWDAASGDCIRTANLS